MIRKKRILVVDDEKDLLKVLNMRLSSAGYEVFEKADGAGAFKAARELMPDLILLDVLLPDIDGKRIKSKLNEDESTARIPVIFLSAKSETTDKIEGLQLGADDYITKPFDSEELLARIKAALDKRDFYEKISMTDGLTALPNTAYFNKQFSLFFNIAKRYKKPFSLIIVDVDDLKSINDMNGHMAGDLILKEFAQIAKKCFRSADIIARYGGDEFTVIMPETNCEQAAISINRLKQNINSANPIQYADTANITFSVSAGCATYEERFVSAKEIFELADKALYENKKSSKNIA
jgi:diguanylate cyclase (GGDEF)-like protein